jgi:FkbM family methyltransferase
MDRDSTFYDVGANIGLYSIIAAMLNSKMVVAFEPSFFNLQILSKNIFKNNLSEKILIVPIPLDSDINQGLFHLRSIEEGGALSSFENDQNINPRNLNDQKNQNKNNDFKYSTISLTLDDFLKNFNKLQPDYLKIDVDGIETKILKGGSKVLENVKSVLVESNSSADEEEIIKIMNYFKLKLIEKEKDSYNLIFNKL